MLILAFDTATDVATSALVDDGEGLGERSSRAATVLAPVSTRNWRATSAPRRPSSPCTSEFPTLIKPRHERRSPSARSREGNDVSLTSSLLYGSPQLTRR